MAVCFKGPHVPQEIILTYVRWYVAYPLSDRPVEELMQERGVSVDHSSVNRGVVQYSPQLEAALQRRQRLGWESWRLDETSLRVTGQWRDLYRAVAKEGQTLDFLRTAQRDKAAAPRFLKQAIRRHRGPETISIAGSEANAAAIRASNQEPGTVIAIRQVKYLHNIIEQDQRAVKRSPRPLLGFKAFDTAQSTLAGVALMHRLKKGPLAAEEGEAGGPPAEQCYRLAA